MRKFREEDIGGRLVYAFTGSSPTAPEVISFLRDALLVPIYEGYGSTEAGMVRSPLYGEYPAGHVCTTSLMMRVTSHVLAMSGSSRTECPSGLPDHVTHPHMWPVAACSVPMRTQKEGCMGSSGQYRLYLFCATRHAAGKRPEALACMSRRVCGIVVPGICHMLSAPGLGHPGGHSGWAVAFKEVCGPRPSHGCRR